MTTAIRRIQKELRDITNDPNESFEAAPVSQNN